MLLGDIMRNKRGLKHYIRFWIMSSAIYLIYVVISGLVGEGIDPVLLFSVLYLPLLFTFFLFLFDTVFDKLLPSKKQKQDDAYRKFLKETTKSVNESLSLSIEDFRRLRENDKFQKALYQAYQIHLNGETDDMNFVFLGKKFKKGTNEFNALEIVINRVKEMNENN